MLGLPKRDFTLRWMGPDEHPGAAAVTYADQGIIELNWDWFNRNPDDYGCLAHEYTHLVQNVPGGTCPPEVIEGIADAVRYKLGLYESWWTPSEIAWAYATLPEDELKVLSRAMAAGTYAS
jgi:hypothetical protein